MAGQPANVNPTGGGRDRLILRAEDKRLISAVAAAYPRTIVSIVGGNCVLMESWRERVLPILVLWYAGMEDGDLMAGILQGCVSPRGKLRRDGSIPAFPVALGLSHSHCRSANLELTPNRLGP